MLLDHAALIATVRPAGALDAKLEVLESTDRRYAHRRAGQGQRRRFVVAGQMERHGTRNVPQRLADPALLQIAGRAAGLPDVHRAEVRLARIRIADALHDAQRVVLM